MNLIHDSGPACTGRIIANWVGNDGKILPCAKRSNTITYSAADIMARVIGGDTTYLPQYIGFIYGTTATPLLDDPDALPVGTRRSHDWARIASDAAANTANIAIAAFTMAPSAALDGDSSLYTANAVTFTGHTGLVQEYGFPTTGATYAADLDTLAASGPTAIYYYHVVLLNRWQSGASITYTPFARAALSSAPFDPKPDNAELAVYWTITFK
jgi:hypothetical protein